MLPLLPGPENKSCANTIDAIIPLMCRIFMGVTYASEQELQPRFTSCHYY